MHIELTLAISNISRLIKEFQEKGFHVNERESGFLLQLDNRVRAIISTCRGWYKHSEIATNKRLTQDKVIDVYINLQKKMIGFVCVTVGTLLCDVRKEKVIDVTHQAFQLFLAECERQLVSVMLNIERNIIVKSKIKYKSIVDVINKVEFETTLIQDIRLVKVLHGRMMPFSQALDPLQLREMPSLDGAGSCFGYVKTWSDTIAKHGCFEATHCVDEQTNVYQANQRFNLLMADWVAELTADSNFQVLLDSMLTHLDAGNTYLLYLKNCHGHGHAIGIRYMEGYGDYEFFDPNFGTFAFHDRNNFIIFLSNLLCKRYFSLFVDGYVVDSSIRLYQMGCQPIHARPCLPDFTHPDFVVTRSGQRELDLVVNTLSAVARHAGIRKLADMSFTDRYWDVTQRAALLQLATSTFLFTLPALLFDITPAMNISLINLFITTLAASFAIEKDSRFFTMLTSDLQAYFHRSQSVVSGRGLERAGFDKCYPWVDNLTKPTSAEYNPFLFNGMNKRERGRDNESLANIKRQKH